MANMKFFNVFQPPTQGADDGTYYVKNGDYIDTYLVSSGKVEKLSAESLMASYDGRVTQAESDLAQLAGDVSELELKDVVQSDKIKDIENVISTMNPNQSAQLSVSGRKTISLPKNASNGGMEVKLEGFTAENLVVNGNFSGGFVSPWAFDRATTPTISSNVLSFTPTSTYGRIYQSVSFLSGFKYYLSARIATSNETTYYGVNGGVGQKILPNTSGVLTFVSDIITPTEDRPNFEIVDKGKSEWGEIKVDTLYGIKVINLTKTFGAGNEPTKEQCDLIFSDYFEGVKSFEPTGRVRSVSLDGLKTSNLYINDSATLRSLPNGVKDEIRPDGKGGYEYIKRVSDKVVITGNDIVSNYDSPARHTNSTAVNLRLNINNTTPTDTTNGNNNAIVKVKEVVFIPQSGWGISNATYWDTPNQYSISSTLSNGYMLIKLSLSHIDTGWTVVPLLTQIKDYFNLNSITLTYQLAEPIITPIQTNGNLISYPSGTVYVENVVADAGIYSTKMDILFTDYPIAILEEIIKHENGVDTYLNVATAVIAGDGLSFTHPDLTDGDLVLFTYAFAKESTNGNITATFYDSNVVKIDTVTGKAYKITDVVTNGVLTRTLTEV